MEARGGVAWSTQGSSGGWSVESWRRRVLLRPGVGQTWRGRVHRRIVSQTVVRFPGSGGCPRVTARIYECSTFSVDLLPLFYSVEEHFSKTTSGGDFPQFYFLFLKFIIFMAIFLDVIHLILLLHRLRPPSPPCLVSVQEGRCGEVVPLYRSRIFLLNLPPVRIVRHFYWFLIVHVGRPWAGRLSWKYYLFRINL